MANLTSDGFAGALPDIVLGKKVPILGVCLGMHLLGRQGTEHGETPGLGLLSGVQRRLVGATPTERVPHTGWNDVSIKRPVPLFDGIPSGADFYFVHSYHLASDNEEIVATVDAGGGVVAAAAADHVMAVQFHPEKSQASGFRLLRNFLAY
jgi:glutamine amidotransferase